VDGVFDDPRKRRDVIRTHHPDIADLVEHFAKEFGGRLAWIKSPHIEWEREGIVKGEGVRGDEFHFHADVEYRRK